MAEFMDVMLGIKRMCEVYDCDKCPLPFCSYNSEPRNLSEQKIYGIERMVADWVVQHPVPQYPSWNETWRKLYPKNSMNLHAPCPKHCFPLSVIGDRCDDNDDCAKCKKQPITAEMAKLMGIEPIGGGENDG